MDGPHPGTPVLLTPTPSSPASITLTIEDLLPSSPRSALSPSARASFILSPSSTTALNPTGSSSVLASVANRPPNLTLSSHTPTSSKASTNPFSPGFPSATSIPPTPVSVPLTPNTPHAPSDGTENPKKHYTSMGFFNLSSSDASQTKIPHFNFPQTPTTEEREYAGQGDKDNEDWGDPFQIDELAPQDTPANRASVRRKMMIFIPVAATLGVLPTILVPVGLKPDNFAQPGLFFFIIMFGIMTTVWSTHVIPAISSLHPSKDSTTPPDWVAKLCLFSTLGHCVAAVVTPIVMIICTPLFFSLGPEAAGEFRFGPGVAKGMWITAILITLANTVFSVTYARNIAFRYRWIVADSKKRHDDRRMAELQDFGRKEPEMTAQQASEPQMRHV